MVNGSLREELINYYSRRIKIEQEMPGQKPIIIKVDEKELEKQKDQLKRDIDHALLQTTFSRYMTSVLTGLSIRSSSEMGLGNAAKNIDSGLVQFLSFAGIPSQQVKMALLSDPGLLSNAYAIRETHERLKERQRLVDILGQAEHYRLPGVIADSLYHTPTLKFNGFQDLPYRVMFFEFSQPVSVKNAEMEDRDLLGILFGKNRHAHPAWIIGRPNVVSRPDNITIISFYESDIRPVPGKNQKTTPEVFNAPPEKLDVLGEPGFKINKTSRSDEGLVFGECEAAPMVRLANLASNLLLLLTVKNLKVDDVPHGNGVIHDLNIIPRTRNGKRRESNLPYQEIVRGHFERVYSGLSEHREQHVLMIEPYLRGPENAPIKRGQEKLHPLYQADLLHYSDYHV